MNYLERVVNATEQYTQKLLTSKEWCAEVFDESFAEIYSEEYCRRAANFFAAFVNKLNNEAQRSISDQTILAKLEETKKSLEAEKIKVQTEKIELNNLLRHEARNELFNEKITSAIERLTPVQVKHIKYTYPIETTGLLVIADQHYDSNFEVKGLFNEVVNQYSPAIFKERMWYLLGQMENDRFDYEKLVIVSCGDALEGLLRMTSLQKLRQPVIQSAIDFAEFMAMWLVEVQTRLNIPIVFELISGNHDVSRSLTSKPEFPEESLAKVIHEFIRLRLANCPNIKVEPYADVYYTTLHGSNLMFVHGDGGNIADTLRYFENLYQIEIDTLYGAHLHRSDSCGMGVANLGDREAIHVPSICGTDPYAKSIHKHSRAGAYFALYSDNGRELSKIYYLN